MAPSNFIAILSPFPNLPKLNNDAFIAAQHGKEEKTTIMPMSRFAMHHLHKGTIMKQKKAKKTIGDTTAHGLLHSAQIEQGFLVVLDRYGIKYRARRTVQDELAVVSVDGCWSGLLRMDAWAKAELEWWEAQLDAAADPQLAYLLLVDGVVAGRVLDPALVRADVHVHSFRVNNAANRQLPAIGDAYSPPIASARPKRTRGVRMWA